jgi:hypothetical protein
VYAHNECMWRQRILKSQRHRGENVHQSTSSREYLNHKDIEEKMFTRVLVVILRIATFYTRGSQRIPVGWGRRMRGVQEEVAQVSCLCRRQDVSREKKSFLLTMVIPSAFLMGVSAICVRQRRQFRVRNDLVRYSLFNFGVNKFISGWTCTTSVWRYNLGVNQVTRVDKTLIESGVIHFLWYNSYCLGMTTQIRHDGTLLVWHKVYGVMHNV